ncbi:MAG: FprA family A-type flavoprotein [Actinobacteria bacterium]|nr:FprA family A-type flavoprotein [Actinomycetota bacterium]
MAPIQLKEGIYWVGVVDWDIRDFHGLSTDAGSSYNAYLVVDEKIALIDAADPAGGAGTLLRHIAEIVDPATINYVISNHSEPDHSGALSEVMKVATQATLLASKDGVKRLGQMYHQEWSFREVGDGEKLSLGKRTLKFFNTPLLHWPETMFTYCPEEKILFSCDAFGSHVASTERFVDEVGTDLVLPHLRKYYAFLLACFRKAVLGAMDKVKDLEIDMIGPSHGPVWRRDIDILFRHYRSWATLEVADKATIVYGTMWGATQTMVGAVADGLKAGGLECRAWNVKNTDASDIVSDLLDSRLILMASPTFVSGIYPPIEAFIPYLRIPRDKTKKLAVFGSFGWSGGATRKLTEILRAEGYEVMDDALQQRFFPGVDEVRECYEFGRGAAEWARGKESASA